MTNFTPVKLKPIAQYIYLDNPQGNAERHETDRKASDEGFITEESYERIEGRTSRWILSVFEKVNGK